MHTTVNGGAGFTVEKNSISCLFFCKYKSVVLKSEFEKKK